MCGCLCADLGNAVGCGDLFFSMFRCRLRVVGFCGFVYG